jgi:sulfoxide reductase heme-binding subunit YedZ
MSEGSSPKQEGPRSDLAWLPYAAYAGALVPGALLAVRALRGELGPNPINECMNGFGELGVKLLILSLACTPARILFGVAWPLRARKALGLAAFTYGVMHLGIYLFLDQRGGTASIIEDIVKRPFIAIGMATLALLTPLAITSTKAMLQRLGARRWKRLHMLVYPAATLAIIHYTMKQKESVVVPLEHGAALSILFAVRIADRLRRRSAPIRRSSSTRTPS